MTRLAPVDDTFLSEAPFRLTASLDLPHSPQQVWSAMTSDDLGSWVTGLDRAVWLSPRPLGKGARRSLRIGRLITIQEEYYSWKDLDHMTFRVTDMSRPLLRGWVEDMRLHPLPHGGTRLSWSMALDSWLLRRVRIPRILQPAVDRFCQRMIGGIRTILPDPAPPDDPGARHRDDSGTK